MDFEANTKLALCKSPSALRFLQKRSKLFSTDCFHDYISSTSLNGDTILNCMAQRQMGLDKDVCVYDKVLFEAVSCDWDRWCKVKDLVLSTSWDYIDNDGKMANELFIIWKELIYQNNSEYGLNQIMHADFLSKNLYIVRYVQETPNELAVLQDSDNLNVQRYAKMIEEIDVNGEVSAYVMKEYSRTEQVLRHSAGHAASAAKQAIFSSVSRVSSGISDGMQSLGRFFS